MSLTDLNSITFGAQTAGTYQLAGHLSLPRPAAGGGQSAVVVTVKQNGTTKYTGLPGAAGFAVPIEYTAFDTIQVSLTSSAAVDQGPNAIKGVVSFG
jgi:hypothetical protein